jgi:phosphoribosylformylglycinamidine cyclo-ligase
MAKEDKTKIVYASTGVNYEILDRTKRLSQAKAKETAHNLLKFGATEVGESRGESAYVWEEKDAYRAMVIEGVGTKSLVADEVRELTGRTHYDTIAQDTVAMIVNDLIVVGAMPQIIEAYFGVGDSNWLVDEERAIDLINGWFDAVNLSGATWGGGETPAIKGIIEMKRTDLAGAAVGIISPKERLTLGEKLVPGDAIFLIESNGIHANGLTLAREIAENLPDRYATLLPDGKSYGESILTPTHIYVNLVSDLFEAGIDIHYMVHITGHGWRKLMRANRDLSYVIDQLPKVQPVFKFIQEQSGNGDEEMYGNFNMGAGFAIFIPDKDVPLAQRIAFQKHGLKSGKAGFVKKGPREVIIKPKGLVFKSETLGVR